MIPDARFTPRFEDWVGEDVLADLSPWERTLAELQYQVELATLMAQPTPPLGESRDRLGGRVLGPVERESLVRQVEGFASILDVGLEFGDYEPCFNRGHGKVCLPPITTDTVYVAAMHELGHAATVTPSMRAGTLECELAAWRWAVDRIEIEQSHRCRASQHSALMTYIHSPAEHHEAGDVLRWMARGSRT